MSTTGAVVFLPRKSNGPSLMLEEFLFDSVALWLAESLRATGMKRFFVACHIDDQAWTAACFPAGIEFVTSDSGDAVERLSVFLNVLEGKVIVIIKPALLDQGDARTLTGLENGGVFDSKDTGVYRVDGGPLSQTLVEGVGLEEALKEKDDRLNSRGVWFQGAYPIHSGWNGRMEAGMVARQHGMRRLLKAGVRIMDPNRCYMGPRVEVGEGTILSPDTILRGETVIGRDCEMDPNAMIRDYTVGDGVIINASQLNEGTIGDGVKIGPSAYVRPSRHMGPGVKVDDFVELKNSTIGEGTKISRLTCVDGSDVGGHINFDCDTVMMNYDGTSKSCMIIGNHTFISCNTNLMAPVWVREGVYTAAGSTITDEAPADSLVITRTHQTIKKQRAAEQRNRRKQLFPAAAGYKAEEKCKRTLQK